MGRELRIASSIERSSGHRGARPPRPGASRWARWVLAWAAGPAAAAAALAAGMATPVAFAADAAAGGAPATAPAAGQVLPDDGSAYRISRFVLRYNTPVQGQPAVDALANVPIRLGVVGEDRYVSPWQPRDRQRRPRDVRTVTRRLGELSGEFYGSAIEAINAQLVQHFNERENLLGVFVSPDPADIDANERDLRPEGRTELNVVIYTGRVGQVRTIASGGRVPEARRIDAAEHRRIAANSPAQAGQLLRRQEIDEYVLRLSRHPGRRVDVAVANTGKPEEVALDYLIAETPPWQVYAQVSNTGTEQTDDWRERFGFLHTQLFGRDDIFNVDYTTTGFEDVHAVALSYDAPVLHFDRVRARGYASYNEFVASEVGLAGDEEFQGTEWMVGAELMLNVYQDGPFFIDLFGGVAYQDLEAEQLAGDGEAQFLQPYVGLRFERETDTTATSAEVRLTYWLGDADREDLDLLGRIGADEDWPLLNWSLSHSFHLEPLLAPKAFAEGRGTLAHEVFLALRGQWAFDRRIVAQAEETVGGFFTVRGYEESFIAADNAVIATAEYRFHLPRALKPHPEGKVGRFLGRDFRFRPTRTYGRTDWDLIFRAFVDYGAAIYSDEIAPEEDEDLLGAGVGVELQLRQNFSIRLDWGFALKDATSVPRETDAGDNRLHVMATFVF